MIRVGLARCRPSYEGLAAPWGPGKHYPEIEPLLGDRCSEGPVNEVYSAVRAALHAVGLDAARYGTSAWNPIGDVVAPGKRTVLEPNYDAGSTTEHLRGGRNSYLLSETVLPADLVINLPKLKTHKKTGVMLALENLVGINGDKNWLPHHSLGSVGEGGDEFPESRLIDSLRSRAAEIARPLLARGRLLRAFQIARRVESATGGDQFIRSGNWYGNQTTWRICCDLHRCLYYSDRDGLHLDAPVSVWTVLTITDGVLAGESESPLAPGDVPLGVVIVGPDPVAVDLVAVRLMGFDEQKLAKLRGPMEDTGPRITQVRQPADVEVCEVDGGSADVATRSLDEITCDRIFVPHAGWVGHVERRTS